MDFRKILSPKTRAEMRRKRERAVAFQELGRKEMAQELLQACRTLADSGLFKGDMPWSSEEWAIYRCIPALARRLDPLVDLRPSEIAKPGESPDPLTWLEGADDQRLHDVVRLIIDNERFSRAVKGPLEVRLAIELLLAFRDRGCAIAVAMDTVLPGSFPERIQLDDRPPLPGAQLIGTYGEHDRVLRYSENEGELEELFRVSSAMRLDEEVTDEDKGVARLLRSWPERLDFDALSIQAFDGTVLRERVFTAAGEPEPAPGL